MLYLCIIGKSDNVELSEHFQAAASVRRYNHQRESASKTNEEEFLSFDQSSTNSSINSSIARRFRAASQYDSPVYANLPIDYSTRRNHANMFLKNVQV